MHRGRRKDSAVPPALLAHPSLPAALDLLGNAHRIAQECACTVEDLAVPLQNFRTAGIADSLLCWLVHAGYVRHGIEHTPPGARRRQLRWVKQLVLGERSCFVLTTQGLALAQRLRSLANASSASPRNNCRSSATAPAEDRPFWNAEEHSLYWRGQLLKHFRQEAPLQEAILNAFQQRHWRRCVPAPRQCVPGGIRKDQLHDAVKHLNRSVGPWLRFRQEGCGSRLCWEIGAFPEPAVVQASAASRRTSRRREKSEHPPQAPAAAASSAPRRTPAPSRSRSRRPRRKNR
jgi:hypothetical protein